MALTSFQFYLLGCNDMTRSFLDSSNSKYEYDIYQSSPAPNSTPTPTSPTSPTGDATTPTLLLLLLPMLQVLATSTVGLTNL